MSKKTIFVVDDSLTTLSQARAALNDEYNVITMPSVKKMFELLEKIEPHLILLDISMPETDGFEAMKLLRTNPRIPEIPVIFLTIHKEKAEKCLTLGAKDFILKPTEPAELRRHIITALSA